MPLGMRAYSMDLRERIVAAVDAGLPQAQAAERFEVSLRTVERYLSRRRRSGSLAATAQRHGPAPAGRPAPQAWLPARVAAGRPPGPARRGGRAPPGRARGGFGRRRRPAGVAVGDVAGDRRPATRA